MAEISLQQYLAKVDSLLEDRAYDEAQFHCRYILQQFPRNIAAYERLGQALILSGRWQDAVEILRRALSVKPDEKTIHYRLSQAFIHLKSLDEALWHLERAYEQDPSDPAITNELTELYRDHRKIDNPHLHLTAGAAARQYIRTGLYDQAVAVLNTAIQKAPGRADLRLLLARINWEADRHVEAAEAAMDTLNLLPDCLEANVMMARFWLEEERPSDGQRYLSRIEPIDPYLALFLASGEETDDYAFELQEADYQTVAHRTLTQTSPDWLTQLDESNPKRPAASDGEEAFDLGELGLDDIDLDDLDLGADDLDFGDDDSWLNDLDTLEPAPTGEMDFELPDSVMDYLDSVKDAGQNETAVVPAPSKKTPPAEPETTDPFLDFGTVDDGPTIKLPPKKRTGLTGLLKLFDDEPEAEAAPEVAETSSMETADASDDANFADLFGDDPIAEELDFGTSDDDLDFGDDDEEDAMAWLQESGIELDEVVPATGDLPATNTADPMAWLKQTGVEIVETEDDEIFDPYGLEDSGTLRAQDEVDPMAWLKQSGIEVEGTDDDDDSMFADDDDDDADALAWLKQSGIEVVDEDEPAQPPPSARATGTARQVQSTSPSMDWLADDDILDEMLSMEALTGDEDIALTPPTAAQAEEHMQSAEDWQEDMSDNNPNWFDDSGEEFEEDALQPEWMPEDVQDAEMPSAQQDVGGEYASEEEKLLDWMAEPDDLPSLFDDDEEYDWSNDLTLEEEEAAAAALLTGVEEDFEWRSELEADSAAVSASSGGMPDWLGEAQSETTGVNDTDSFEHGDFDEFEEGDETPDWLMDVPSDEELTEDDSFVTDGEGMQNAEPDWLVGATAEVGADTMSDDETPQDDDFDGFDFRDVEQTDEEAETLMPDWLASAQIETTDEDEANLADESSKEFAGLFDDFETAEEDAEESVPDWLASAQPQAEVESIVESSSEDAFGFGFEEEETDEEIAPDWLSGVTEETAEDVVAASSEDAFGFGFEEEEAEEQPSWLTQAQANVDEEEEEEAFSLSFEEFEEDAEEEATPDWLSGVTAATVETTEDDDSFELDFEEEETDDEEQPSWLTQAQANVDDEEEEAFDLGFEEFEEDAEEEATPDWLSGVAATAETSEDDDDSFELDFEEEETDDEEFALGFEEFEEEADEEQPDWLSGVPAATVDTSEDDDSFEFDFEEESDEEEAEEAVVPDWLSGVSVSDNVEDEEEAEIDFGFDLDDDGEVQEATPDWLSGMAPAAEAEEFGMMDFDEEAEEEDAFGFQAESVGEDWLSGIGVDADADEEDLEFELETGDAPDWLSAVSVEDDDEPEEEIVQSEDAPDWLASMGAVAINEDEAAFALDDESIDMEADEFSFENETYREEDTSPDWLTNMASADEEAEEEELVLELGTEDTPDWLMGGDFANDQETDLSEDEEMPLAPIGEIEEDAPDWLSAMREEESAEEEIGDAVYASSDYTEDKDFAEVEMTSADNAPDWLNAMVPGLDVDYEAEEDAPVEQEYVAASSAKQVGSKKDFDWLSEIVEEEMYHPPATLPGSTRLPRFTFSRPPKWLNGEAERAHVPSASVQNVSEMEFDDIGDDLPDWLDFDDAEFGDKS